MTLCECGCGQTVNPGRRFIQRHNWRGKLNPNKGKRYTRTPLPLCECGCGRKVLYPWNRFLPGHWNNGKRKKTLPIQGPLPLCKCGCGQVVKNLRNKYIKGHLVTKPKIQGPKQLCACGCGEVVISVESKFYYRHQIIKSPVQGPLQLCECGCGKVVTKIQNRFIQGHGATGRKRKSTPDKTFKTSRNGKNYCRMCKSKNVLERHHLVPRKYGVNDDEYNLITLCKNCHDKVEMLTEEWIDFGKEYSALIFRRLITNIW